MKEAIGPMVHHTKREPQTTFMQFLGLVLAIEIRFQGIENLREVQQLIHQGKKIVFMSNHLSYADQPVFDQALKRNGFGEIANKVIALQGLKIERNLLRRFLISSSNTIRIWPPTIHPADEKEKNKKFAMDRQALEYAKLNLNNGYHLLIFPEGTRSKTKKLQRGEPGVTHFLTLSKDTFVVPVGICGTEKILPIGRSIPLPKSSSVTFGEPIIVSQLVSQFGHLPKDEKRREMIDFIMKKIAGCLLQQYRGVYS